MLPYGGKLTFPGGRYSSWLSQPRVVLAVAVTVAIVVVAVVVAPSPRKYFTTPSPNLRPVSGKWAFLPRENEKPCVIPVDPTSSASVDISFFSPPGWESTNSVASMTQPSTTAQNDDEGRPPTPEELAAGQLLFSRMSSGDMGLGFPRITRRHDEEEEDDDRIVDASMHMLS
jgi:hypothetical protein